MSDDLRVVFESRNRLQCSDRSLVLDAAGIAHQVIQEGLDIAILVPAEESARAAAELRMYDAENPPRPAPRKTNAEQHDPLPGLIGYVLIVCLVAGVAGFAWFGKDWRLAGHLHGAAIRDGEVWRLITALTLHADIKHLLANLVFGVFFGLFAGRLLGSGYAWLTILLAAIAGNTVNTFLLDPTHRSIGASTAVFAALGVVAGYVWRGKLMSQDQDRWTARYGPIIGGLALLMYTGTGSVDPETGINNTDIGAHFFGFLAGLASGILLIRFGPLPDSRRGQVAAGMASIAIVVVAWFLALLL